MEIPGLEAIKEMVFETETNPGKKGSDGKGYKSKQVCCRCMGCNVYRQEFNWLYTSPEGGGAANDSTTL